MVAKARQKASADTTGTDTVVEEKPNLGYNSSVYSGPDSFSGKFLEKLEGLISDYLSTSGKLAASEGNEKEAIENFILSSDDAKMVELRTEYDRISAELKTVQAMMNEYAGTQVKSESLSDDEKTSLREQLKTLREKVALGKQNVLSSGEMMEIDPENVTAAAEALMAKMPVAKRGKAKGSEGSKLPRAYAKLTVSGGTMEKPVDFENFSRAALGLNTEVELLQKAFANAAGVAWENIKTVDTPQSFDFSPDEKRTYHIVTTPTARPGRKAASSTTADTAVADTKASDNSAGNSADANTDGAPGSTDTSAESGTDSVAKDAAVEQSA